MQVTPDKLGRLARTLERRHEQKPFRVHDSRKNVKDLKSIAADIGIRVIHMRGCIDIRGAFSSDSDYHWGRIGDMTVDLTLPVKNPAFAQLYKQYVVDEINRNDLIEGLHHMDFHDRVLPGVDIPDGVLYSGVSIFSESSQVRQRGTHFTIVN